MDKDFRAHEMRSDCIRIAKHLRQRGSPGFSKERPELLYLVIRRRRFARCPFCGLLLTELLVESQYHSNLFVALPSFDFQPCSVNERYGRLNNLSLRKRVLG
jgi:hypothetical protein